MTAKPTKTEAQNAVAVLLSYLGENPSREGLLETPDRVIRSYDELFRGYTIDVEQVLDKRFYDISDYNDIVLLRSIGFSSMCEHHMLPFIGKVDIAYIPSGYVVGVSKLARLVDVFAKRLQIQEKMTSQIANALQENLSPRGVAVKVSAAHSCMSLRGVSKQDSVMDTTHYTGVFSSDHALRQEFFSMIR